MRAEVVFSVCPVTMSAEVEMQVRVVSMVQV